MNTEPLSPVFLAPSLFLFTKLDYNVIPSHKILEIVNPTFILADSRDNWHKAIVPSLYAELISFILLFL